MGGGKAQVTMALPHSSQQPDAAHASVRRRPLLHVEGLVHTDAEVCCLREMAPSVPLFAQTRAEVLFKAYLSGYSTVRVVLLTMFLLERYPILVLG